MNYLVITDCNWADELDINGFEIISTEKYHEFQNLISQLEGKEFGSDRLKEGEFVLELGFGSNQSVEFDSVESINECFEFVVLGDSDADALRRLFGSRLKYGFGQALFNDLIENIQYLLSDFDLNENIKKLISDRQEGDAE